MSQKRAKFSIEESEWGQITPMHVAIHGMSILFRLLIALFLCMILFFYGKGCITPLEKREGWVCYTENDERICRKQIKRIK